jgi:hypothetical protein
MQLGSVAEYHATFPAIKAARFAGRDVAFQFCFVLIILYSLYLEYDRVAFQLFVLVCVAELAATNQT